MSLDMEVFRFKQCTGNGNDETKKKIDPITHDPLENYQFISKIGNVCYNDTTLVEYFKSLDPQVHGFPFHDTPARIYADIVTYLGIAKDPVTNLPLTLNQIETLHNKLSEYRTRDKWPKTKEDMKKYLKEVIDAEEVDMVVGEQPSLRLQIAQTRLEQMVRTAGGSRKSKKRRGKPYKKSCKSKRKR